MNCPSCGSELKTRQGKHGPFLGCSGYPACKHTQSLFVKKETDIPVVNASDIGSVAFCPQSLYLTEQGHKQNKIAHKRMAFGRTAHRKISGIPDRRCYIATYAFGENHSITEQLRRWRDAVLLPSWYGKVLVLSYYSLSPILITVMGRFPWFHHVSRSMIQMLIRYLRIDT